MKHLLHFQKSWRDSACNFIKKEDSSAEVPCRFWETLLKNFFAEQFQATATDPTINTKQSQKEFKRANLEADKILGNF